MEVVIACGSKLAEYLVEATINQARYLFCFDSIVKDLEDEEINLNLAKDGIEKEVKREEDNTGEIEKDVEKWQKDVKDAMADVQTLKAKIQVKKNCWCWRYWLGRKATKMTSLMLKLKNDGTFSTMAHLKSLPGVEFSIPIDFMSFEATEMASEQIIEALKNEKTKMVGLYGAGGSGKTTLAMVMGDKLQHEIFDEVVVAVVSRRPDFEDVQSQLAKSLRVELKEKTKEDKAKRLYVRFKETKSKILIVLDDVWGKFDLKNELGIPVDDNDNGCKILLTTRRKQVCDLVGCNVSIPLGILKPEEGLSLLKRYARIDYDHTLIDVLEDVAGECKGLPLAIAAVGSALRGKGVDEWKAAYRKLKNAKLIDIDDIDKDKDIYACLKWSYDYLVAEDSKLCFLMCSLFPEDHKIDLEDLVRYGVGLGWYQDVESIEDARSLLRVTINGLKNSSLLLETGEEGFVRMHDIVRDVALWIGLNEKKFFSKAGNELTEWPKVEGMEQYTGISMMGNSIEMLPNGLVCPDLHILLLGNKDFSFEVPDQFFEGMKALRVVTIICGELSLKSLRFLTNLQVLQLIQCDVYDVDFLEKLNTLQILLLDRRNYRYSDGEIPKDLGDKLSELKLFDADFIDASAIARFSRLEEFYGWINEVEVEETSCANSFPELRRYNIQNGKFVEIGNQTKALKIYDIEAPSLGIFSALYQNLQTLQLRDVSGCENIVPSIDQQGLKELTSLDLHICGDLQCILDASQHEKRRNLVMLSRLAELELDELPKLRWIWKAPAQHVSLQNLAKVKVIKCNKLTHLFTLSQARSLRQLKSLCVEDCERLECIVEAKYDANEREINVIGGDGENIALPMLRELLLRNLPNLISFCSENYYSTWQALRELNLSNCPRLNVSDEFQASVQYMENLQTMKLGGNRHLYNVIPTLMKHGLKSLEELGIYKAGVQVLFLQQEAIIGGDGQESKLFPSLKKLDLHRLLELEVLYKGPTHIFSLQNLTTLHVNECNRLRHLLSLTLAQNLLQLEELWITFCLELEQVIDDSEDQYQHYLQSISFPNLRRLRLMSCPKLKRLFHISIASSLEKLEELMIHNVNELGEVFWQSDGTDGIDVKEIVMTQLKMLSLYDLPKYINFCPEGYQFIFPSLRSS